MAISFVNSTNASGFISTPATISCNVPSSVADGDLLLSFVTLNSATQTITAPVGWTKLDDIEHDVNHPLTSAIYYRIASSEPSSYDWTHSSTNKWIAVVCEAWRGVDNTSPFDTVYSQSMHTESYPLDGNPPNEPITTVTNNAVVVLFHHHRDSLGTTAAPTDYTLDGNSLNSPNRCLQIAYKTVATAGAESPGDWLHTVSSPEDSQVWSTSLRPAGASRSITNIDGDDSVLVGQTGASITAVGLDESPSTQTVTLGNQALTITNWNSGNPIVSIPTDIQLKWDRTDLDLVVTDDAGSVTLQNVTLLPETGWEYIDFNGTPPGPETESGYELVQTDYVYDMVLGDQWIFRSETGLSYDSQTLPTLNPPATVTSQYRFWNNLTGSMSIKTTYTITQKPLLSNGAFTHPA